jgi:hypothetical protein
MDAVNWRQTLSEVEQSINECLETLDRYEAAFAQAIAEVDPVVTLERLRLPEIAPLHEAKLAEAERTTQDVEDLLKEQDGIWSRWKETLATWHGLLERAI